MVQLMPHTQTPLARSLAPLTHRLGREGEGRKGGREGREAGEGEQARGTEKAAELM